MLGHSGAAVSTRRGFLHNAGDLALDQRPAYACEMARPDCSICQGSGWKIVERTTEGAQALAAKESARPGSAGGEPRMVWAVPCDCTKGDRTERMLAKARVPELYWDRDFENYDTDLQYESNSPKVLADWKLALTQAKLLVERFAEEFPVGCEHGLLLMGTTGVGKTHLAVAALKKIVLRGHNGLFCEYRALLKEIQESYNPVSEATEMGVLEPVLKADILVLDDVGSSKPSLWAIETVGHILNTRYNERRLTIITTNYLDAEFAKGRSNESQVISTSRRDGPPPDPSRSTSVTVLPSGEMIAVSREDTLEQRVGKRIRSRLYEMCRTIEIFAPDYRKEIRNISRLRGYPDS